MRGQGRIPEFLRPLFWDHRFAELSLSRDHDLVLGRVLGAGDRRAVAWARRRVGDEALRDWLERTRGRSLRPEQVTYFGLVLKVPDRRVRRWLGDARRRIWDAR